MRITQEGFLKLQEDLQQLNNELKEALERREIARSYGDLSENSEFTESSAAVTTLTTKIELTKKAIMNAQIIDHVVQDGIVAFNSSVTILDLDTDVEKTFKIVGETESDVSAGLLSEQSPLAIAMWGKVEGDLFELETRDGNIRSYKIIKIGQ